MVNTGTLNLTDGGQINTDTFGRGNGGNIIVNTREEVNISGFGSNPSGLFSNVAFELEQVNAGNIAINTDNLNLTSNGGNIAINTGNLNLTNGGQVLTSINSLFGQGNGGNITINTGNLNLTNGGEISAETDY